jgi:diaminohydroxyphosphoribosylaminopyrimidine deaminase/5-amino-6-(5-phosphoribosylamino)uracil reductase
VAEVVYAIGDPNPLVNGLGHASLEAAGVVVRHGVCEAEAQQINRPFFKYVTVGQPFVTAKFAISLDGKIATRSGESRWITNSISRQRAHELRDRTDVILVGAGTVIADDPQLTTRLPRQDVHHPLRIVVDSRGRVPPTARLFDPALPGKTVLATTKACDPTHCAALEACGVEVWKLPPDPQGRVSLSALLDEIGRHDKLTLLVEGGSELLGVFFAEKLVDRVWIFIAPIIIGGKGAPGPVGGMGAENLSQALHLGKIEVEVLDGDLWIQADVPQDKNTALATD